MSLSITNDIVYDESLTLDATDNDVASLSFTISGLSNFISAPSGFPQYAELNGASFIDTSTLGGAVTDYSLSGWDPTANGGAGGSVALSTSTGVATDLYVGSSQIYLFATSDSDVVVGRLGTGLSTDPIALVIALDETVSGGAVTDVNLGMVVYAPLVHADGSAVDDGDTLDLADLLSLEANFTTSEEHNFDTFAGVPSGSDAFAMILPDGANTLQLIATGFSGETEQKITISQDASEGSIGGGGSGQHVGSGNSLRIDFVTGGDFSKADTSSEDNNPANISYGLHADAFKASFQLVQVNPGSTGTATSLNIFAYDVVGNAQGNAFVTDAIATDGATVTIDPDNVKIYDASHNPITPAVGQITAVSDGNGGWGVHITGLLTDYTVEFTTPGDSFDRFIVTNTQPAKGSGSNVTFDIGHIHVSTLTTGSGTASAELGSHLIFEDAGPSVSLSGDTASLSVDDSSFGTDDSTSFAGLFSSSYGADGAGSVDYVLGIKGTGQNSTLVDTLSGHGVFLYMDGDDVVGKVGSSLTTADSNGAEVFRISVDASGNVTLDQSRAVVHGDPNASNESVSMSAADLVTLTATVSDSDTDSASQVANIGTSFSFLDDEPTMTGHVNPADNYVQVANSINSSDADSFTLTPGNDGISSATGLGYTIVGPADSSGDYRWSYTDGTHTSIIETYKGANLFSLSLDAATGNYTMTMLGSLPYSQLNLDTNNIKAGGPTGSIDVGTLNNGGDYVEISGTAGGSVGNVNASNGNVGVNNGNLDGGESLSFSLFSSGGTLIPFYGLDMGTKTAQGATYHLYGVLDSDHTTVMDLGIQSLTKGGTIHYAGNVLLDSIIVQETAGNAVKIGLAGVHLLLPPADAGFHFTAQLTDGDGDYSQLGFDAFIDGNGGGVDHSTVLFPA